MALARISTRDSSLEQYSKHVAHWIWVPGPLSLGVPTVCLPFTPLDPHVQRVVGRYQLAGASFTHEHQSWSACPERDPAPAPFLALRLASWPPPAVRCPQASHTAVPQAFWPSTRPVTSSLQAAQRRGRSTAPKPPSRHWCHRCVKAAPGIRRCEHRRGPRKDSPGLCPCECLVCSRCSAVCFI